MLRLALILFTLVSAALAGTGVIVVLSLGEVDLPAILIGAGAGFVLAIPVSWLIAKRLYSASGN